MKIVLSFNEMTTLRDIMETVKEGSTNALLKSVKGNSLVTYKTDFKKSNVTINIDKYYMEDFLNLCGKYMKIIVTQVKTFIGTFEMFQDSAEEIIEKHSKGGEKNA